MAEISSLPLTVDEFIHLENKPDGDEPAELLDLRRRAPQYISALQPGVRLSTDLLKTSGEQNTWKLELGREFVLGQIGTKIEEHPRSELTVLKEEVISPEIPKWSGITYQPKISGSPTVRSLRRVKGKRVRPDYIFGADDRQVYYPTGYPWRCIGKVLVWNDASSLYPDSSGTGALVGTNVVLTASHMIPWGSQSWKMQFIPAYYDGKSLLGSGVHSYVQIARGYNPHSQGDDMAVLKLYTPLGDTLGWFGSKTYSDSWEDGDYWTKCGYPGAVASASRPSRITWFPVIDDDSDGAGVELEYHADSSGGDSGGPVFGWWDGLPYVIGTHSGGEEEYEFPFSIVKNNVAAGGSSLVSLIKWAHDNW